ncbi:GTP cyclohydrolase I FolE [Agromyces bauzanensis]|uniref:GTP cyclohydrolase 1 n=2 Tax=Agromyces bauzanensis TaxID=1308924 RepID=A0A917PGB7_9MICO|nr:GTP cyclohydrolase 1 [Agromyces bauzanensis]
MYGMTSIELAEPGAARAHLHAVAPDTSAHSIERAAVAPGETVEPVDRARATAAVAELLTALGRDIRSPHLAETPRRVADSFIELLTPRPFEATTFPNDEGYDDLIVVAGIPFDSLCEHHLLPFSGTAHVGYVPGARLLGLSKFARVVERFARDLQVQERLTRQVAGWIEAELAPAGVGVVLEAEHLCMSVRGVQARGTRTVTSSFVGVVRDDGRTRREFLARCGLRGIME